jgi:hypothetical protein
MENPRLTFATPTVLAGDKSQVALVAHELAHSWSGNLVTNATWRDFWLNEGFTVYLERRIVEDVYGPERVAMESALGLQELRKAVAELPEWMQVLHVEVAGRDPDEAFSGIPYEKGALFLETLAAKLGREQVDAFLRGYFDDFAFQSVTTGQFEAYLKEKLFRGKEPPIDLDTWIRKPGLPAGHPEFSSPRFAEVEGLARQFAAGELEAKAIDAAGWTTLEWLTFLRGLPKEIPGEELAELDAEFHLTESGNAEIACQWFLVAIPAGYRTADPAIERFLTTVGRRKFLAPLYEALAATPEGKARAEAIFAKAKPSYHPISAGVAARALGVADD